MIPDDNRFESDPDEILPEDHGLPAGWEASTPDPDDPAVVARLTALLRAHEDSGRGWAGASSDDVLVEVSEQGLRTRENIVVRDAGGEIRAWGSVHDRASGRMLYVHIVDRTLPDDAASRCSDVLFGWAEGQAREVGAARGLDAQQIDTGAFADDDRQHAWLEAGGFVKVRTWWQMTRPVVPEEATSLAPPREGVTIRRVASHPNGLPVASDLHLVHQMLEASFEDHFNSYRESFP